MPFCVDHAGAIETKFMTELDHSCDVPTTKKERTRQIIVEAAIREFLALGYDKTTVPNICAAAGISRSTFFTHFSSKSGLLVEMGARIAQSWREEKATLTTDHSIDLLQSFILFIFVNTPNANIARCIAADFVMTHGHDYSSGEGPGTIFGEACEIIAAGQKEKLITKKLPVSTLAHLFLGGAFPFMDMLDEKPPEKVADLYLEYFLNGAAR